MLNGLWISAAWMWCERETWLWILPIALSINGLLLTYDQVLNFRVLSATPLTGNDPWGLLKIVNELCTQLQVPMPKIYLIERPSAQIFSYAKTQSRTRLFVTHGTLDLLSSRQLRAALTFQLMTIRSSYNVFNYWVAAILDLFYRLGKTGERAFGFMFGWRPALAAWFISPWLWLVRALLLGAGDFYKLDRETANSLDTPEDLAQALWKMEAYAQTRPWPEPWIFAHMCMVSPLTLRGFYSLARVQPPLHGRIKSLVGRYPL